MKHDKYYGPMTVDTLIRELSNMPLEAKVTLHTGADWAYIMPHTVRKVDESHVQIVSSPEVDTASPNLMQAVDLYR